MVGHYIHHDIYLTSIYAWRPCVAVPIGEIAAWSPCTAVPNEVIDKLHAAFYDIDMTPEQREAFQALETYTL